MQTVGDSSFSSEKDEFLRISYFCEIGGFLPMIWENGRRLGVNGGKAYSLPKLKDVVTLCESEALSSDANGIGTPFG